MVELFTRQSKYSPKVDLVTSFVWLARSAGDHQYNEDDYYHTDDYHIDGDDDQCLEISFSFVFTNLPSSLSRPLNASNFFEGPPPPEEGESR